MKILGPRVAIEIVTEKEEKTTGGIFFPGSAQNDVFPVDTAKVIAVGTGYYQNGILIPVAVKEGDMILVPKGSPQVALPLKDDKRKLVVIGEQEIVAIL